MLCENCGKNEATTYIHTVINGVVTEKNLCGYCAAKGGYHGFGQNSLTNMLASMFSDVGKTAIPTKRCECCGSAFSDIAETGKVGCSKCYNTFYNELLPYIKRLHSGTTHIGKKPIKQSNALVSIEKHETGLQRSRIDILKEQLQRCIEREEYEKAATIRDEIKGLNKEGE